MGTNHQLSKTTSGLGAKGTTSNPWVLHLGQACTSKIFQFPIPHSTSPPQPPHFYRDSLSYGNKNRYPLTKESKTGILKTFIFSLWNGWYLNKGTALLRSYHRSKTSPPPTSPYCCCCRRQRGGLSPDCQTEMYEQWQLKLKSWFLSSEAVKTSSINQGQLRKTESPSFLQMLGTRSAQACLFFYSSLIPSKRPFSFLAAPGGWADLPRDASIAQLCQHTGQVVVLN